MRVYTQEGDLIAQFGEKRREPLALRKMLKLMQEAFLAAEDDRFFQHPGVDYQGVLRAAWHLVRTGEKEQGGSTITMQLARNIFLSSERTYGRKLREIILALKMEQELTKQEILELYLNMIYLGNRAYGVGAAAEVYYGREIGGLNLSQIAMIAGLPKAPSSYNPIADPERALERRNYVLRRMRELNFIDNKAYYTALKQPVTQRLHNPDVAVQAPYVAEMVREKMVARFGADAYTGGYKVYTTVHTKLQRAASETLRAGLIAYDIRHGYRGAEAHVDQHRLATRSAWDAALAKYTPVGGLKPGLVVDVKQRQVTVYLRGGRRVSLNWQDLSWTRPYVNKNALGPEPQTASDVVTRGDIVRVTQDNDGNWRLSQVPNVAGALVSLNPNNGAIAALVGGFDFNQSNFNRAVQAHRQPGSAFKPFIYSAALEHGFTPASIINDAPVVFSASGLEGMWRPENYSGKFYGPTRMRVALAESRNMVSIRLLSSIGLKAAMDHIVKFGFDPKYLPFDLSLALGSGSVTPLELATGYAVFANGGYRVEPYLIQRIENTGNHVIYKADPATVCNDPCQQTGTSAALVDTAAKADTGASSRINDAMAGPAARSNGSSLVPRRPRPAQRVISAANAYQMVSMMKDVIRHGTGTKALVLSRNDLAGKTGTTDDLHDAWFSGYNANLVTTVWVGFDRPRSLGINEVGGVAALPIWIDFMRVALKGQPERSMPQPEGMITVRIDPQTGLLANADTKDGIFETFRADQIPKREALEPERVSNGPHADQPTEIPEQLF
ncbi:MAG TPA: penicillin-binding protein 1A [Gammaproteobacteria bacterium]|nr:penicillin-binding protein 1A [Gammaproteobacteria bacterium]